MVPANKVLHLTPVNLAKLRAALPSVLKLEALRRSAHRDQLLSLCLEDIIRESLKL